MSHSPNSPKLILIAGPYRSNTNDDPLLIHANYRRMNEVALEVFRMGHLPITGEAIALSLIEVAGSQTFGDAVWNEIFHSVGRRLVECVDAVLRIGGPSIGADEMVRRAVPLCSQGEEHGVAVGSVALPPSADSLLAGIMPTSPSGKSSQVFGVHLPFLLCYLCLLLFKKILQSFSGLSLIVTCWQH